MLRQSTRNEELAYITQCITEAKEKISQQKEKVDRATSRGLTAYEERGILLIMAETMDTMIRRRAQLLNNRFS